MSAWHEFTGNDKDRRSFSRMKRVARKEQENKSSLFDYRLMNSFSWFGSVIVGVLVGFGVVEVLSFPFLIELIPSLAVAGAIGLLSKRFVFIVAKPRTLIGGTKVLESKIVDAEDKLRTLRQEKQLHRNSKIGKKLDVIVDSAYDLLDLLDDKPNKIIAARDFLGYYLDECISIIRQYKNMEDGKHKIEAAKNVEEVLSGVESAFKKQIEKFQKNEAVDLGLDIQVLKNDLKGKGIK